MVLGLPPHVRRIDDSGGGIDFITRVIVLAISSLSNLVFLAFAQSLAFSSVSVEPKHP